VYSLLASYRGWSSDDSQQWLAKKLITTLVPDTGSLTMADAQAVTLPA